MQCLPATSEWKVFCTWSPHPQ